ncbi:MAG: 30S ribosome-binding factor RbfA [Gammaproteobacteria bacterium]|nr:30S ribosome-binding factor RbfA [Gammaproteobacteria bacterium]
MKTPSKRTQRVAELIQRRVAQLIQQELKDPRLTSWVTISAVDVSSDFSYAKIYFTAYQSDPKQVLTILNSAASFLRAQLAKTLTTRTVPQLQFVHDDSLEYGRRLQKIIDNANPNEVDSDTDSDITP